MQFRNFSIWRGRLPHWRADDVRYYVTFRHRRELDEQERRLLLRALLKPDGRKWDLMIVCVMPDSTELIFEVRDMPQGKPYELSDILEPAKRKAGNQIIKKTGERFPPFYGESFDRIIRDDAEFEERWLALMDAPVHAGLAPEPEEYEALWVSGYHSIG
jgi:hypothetical protein